MSLRALLDGVRATLRDVRGGGRGWTLLAVAGGWLFVLGLRFVVPALLPSITDDFPVSDTAAGAAITLLWMTYGVMQFPAGALVDRAGERRLLVASVLVSAVALAGYVFSPTFAVFLAATALFGFGSGLYGPPRGTVLTRTFPERDGLAFGAVLAAGSIGAAVLPVVATGVAATLGWRAAIAVTVPGFLVFAGVLWRSVPDYRVRSDGGRLRATAADVGRAVLTRRIALAIVGITLMLFVLQGLTAFLTTYLVDVKGLGEGTAGALFGLFFVFGAVSQSVAGSLADRYGHGAVMAAVALVSAPPLVALPYLSGLPMLAVASAFAGVRLGVGPVSNAYIVALLPPEVRGTAWGLIRTAFFSVGAFGSTIVGAMADSGLFAESLFLLAALSLVAFVVYLFLPARASQLDESAPN